MSFLSANSLLRRKKPSWHVLWAVLELCTNCSERTQEVWGKLGQKHNSGHEREQGEAFPAEARMQAITVAGKTVSQTEESSRGLPRGFTQHRPAPAWTRAIFVPSSVPRWGRTGWKEFACKLVRKASFSNSSSWKVQVAQSCLNFWDPRDYTVHGILQARILECVFPSPGDLPKPGIKPRSPALQADSLPAEPPSSWRGIFILICTDTIMQLD